MQITDSLREPAAAALALLTVLAGVLAAVTIPAAAQTTPQTPAHAASSPGASGSSSKAAATASGSPEIVSLPSAHSPLVAIRLMFRAGSIDDPAGKEGLSALTAQMVAQAGTAKRSYSQLLEDLYPLAAQINGSADREVTVFSGTVPRAALAPYVKLFEEALLTPGFSDSDFHRNQQQLLSYITDTLRSSNDELLGLEALQDKIFAGHPYGHPSVGTVAGLKSITLDDVREFYRTHYTRANLMIGVAGGYPAGFIAKLNSDLARLPAGTRADRSVPPPAAVSGRNITVIDKETASVGLHFGFPLALTRKDADYYPLMVANSYLGEHRTFNGVLMVQLRQLRGLNYGDYSYIEYWDAPPFTSHPAPNVPRHDQYFSVWVRPVVPEDAQFALRAALYEVDRLQSQGMTQKEFELTRNFVVNYSKLWVQDLSSRLGYHMDSRYYGMPYFIDEVEQRLKGMTVDDVNRAARKYLATDNFDAIVVSAHAKQLADTLQRDEPSPKKYNSQVSNDVLEADKTITTLKVHPTKVEVLPVAQAFEN